MTETLTGKQVLALLAQDAVPEIECFNVCDRWVPFDIRLWRIEELRTIKTPFRIKPIPTRRLSVTLSNGEVVSWPEPVREVLKYGKEYWQSCLNGTVNRLWWTDNERDREYLAFGNVHLTREAAQEHADALRRINCQEVV